MHQKPKSHLAWQKCEPVRSLPCFVLSGSEVIQLLEKISIEMWYNEKKNLKNKQQKNPTVFYFFLTEDVKRGLTLLPLAQKK